MTRPDAADRRSGDTDNGLLAALNVPGAKGSPGMPCGVDYVRTLLADPVRERIDEIIDTMKADRAALRPPRYSAAWLADTLTAHGHRISGYTVQRHVQGKCRCGR